MALRTLINFSRGLLAKSVQKKQLIRFKSSDCLDDSFDSKPLQAIRARIGDREIVCFGKNGGFMYVDHPAFPFPALRFKEVTPEILCLREKEKGDWRNLSIDEKKILYRASFCQTYSEMLTLTGQWKSVIGVALMMISAGLWLHIILRLLYDRDDPLPDSFTEECQKAQLERMLILEVNPIEGLASKWDYENKKWK